MASMDFVTRETWGARAPKQNPVTLTAPRLGLAVHWEGPHMGDFSHDACAGKVKSIQDFHMDVRGWNDIAYNWVVCPHGIVFVGRGPGIRSAAQGTNDGNAGYEAVCFLGGVDDHVSDDALNALYELREWRKPWDTQPHSHFFNTACPGSELRAWIAANCPQPDSHKPSPGEPQIPDAGHPSHPTLYEGISHPERYVAEVKFLQSRLNANGAKLVVDGSFGPKTQAAVRTFQSKHGLAVDGIVGPHTWGALL